MVWDERLELGELSVKVGVRLLGTAFLLGLVSAAGSVRAEDMRRPPRPAEAPGPGVSSAVLQGPPAAPQDLGDGRMRGRMTPDERRRLRADIANANRNVYPLDHSSKAAPAP